MVVVKEVDVVEEESMVDLGAAAGTSAEEEGLDDDMLLKRGKRGWLDFVSKEWRRLL